jgi:hypothetical protein
VYAKQKLSPLRPRGSLFLCLVLLAFLVACPRNLSADSLEDAARALARKVSTVAQRERRFLLSWQNHSSLTEANSQALKESFAAELGGENLAEKAEPGVRVLLISVQETPAFYILIANVPATAGDATRISRIARGVLPSAENLGVRRRLLKELIWEQQEPILDAIETGEASNKLGPLLILNRENLSLYRRENDRWGLQDTKRIPTSEKAMRVPRGEIRFSLGDEKQDSLVLPGQTCDVAVADRIALNCRGASHSWREGMFLASACDRSVWWLRGETGDWTLPDKLLLRNPSLPKSAPSEAELDLPGPLLSIATGRHMQGDTAVVLNLTTGNYEVYRITLACAN